MRVFFDTNVVVSSFTSHGLCAELFRQVLASHTLILSEQVLAESEDVLLNRFEVPASTVVEILKLLRRQEIASLPAELPTFAIRDPDDLTIVAAALHARADVLVSGDKDLTSLPPFPTLKILTPRLFMDLLSSPL